MLRCLVILLLMWSGPLRAAETPVILVFGDSLSAAYGMATEQGWVALLQARLQSQGLPHRVVNASVSGETTSGGLTRLPAALRQYRPSIVVLELGANDGLRGLPIAQIRYNLAGIVTQIQGSGAKVLLLGMRIPTNYGPAYTGQFFELYQDIARRYRIGYLPFLLDGVAGQSQLTQDDGLHPTAAAQSRVLDNVWPRLRPMLGR